LQHSEFLDLCRNDPSPCFAEALGGGGGEQGPTFVYSASFEKGRITELSDRFPNLHIQLLALNSRMVGLFNIAVERYYPLPARKLEHQESATSACTRDGRRRARWRQKSEMNSQLKWRNN